jgi:SAM-dependent methyltransferase
METQTRLEQARSHATGADKTPLSREWRRFERMLGPAGHRMLDVARLRPGERVLDVACGPGGTTLEAAHRVGAGGAAAGVDTDVHAIRVAMSRAREQLLGWATFAVGDVEHAEFPRGVFHAIVSRFGISSVRAPRSLLARASGALAPDGRLVFVCWGSAQANAWHSLPRAVVTETFGPELAQALGPGAFGKRPFGLADRAALESLLGAQGFAEVSVEPFDAAVWMGDDVDDAVEFFYETEGRTLDDRLDQKSFERLTSGLRRALAPHARPDGVWLPAAAWIVAARIAPRPDAVDRIRLTG